MKFDLGSVEGKAYIRGSDKVLYLSPTNGWDDVRLYPLMIPVRHHKKGLVHLGFYLEYMRRRDELLALYNMQKPTIIEAYSIGATWAKLLSVDVALLYGEHPKVRLKGAPKVGNMIWCKLFNETVQDVEQRMYGGDIVCSLPPGYLKEKGYKREGPDRKWWQIKKMFSDHGGY